MLLGLIGVIHDEQSIVVVVCLAQRMHGQVPYFVDIRECRCLPSEGKGLPQDGEQHQGKGELAAHGRILVPQ
ncbi:hypothetical protein HMPREF9701_00933 [Delftia acidovorans CCUG 274B]|uniref:Uncharacterized protein n=1 Tax=Delftia lacustris TaxID=558537 RepID=A0A1H3SGD2_9BURK|nr:hypothetical protein HMPREF9701_00933 [Delftia acidovorans CCUG 274B]SDZ37032.1 hypothetical protein SAMN05421547_12031 [Delftia lacustris]